MEWTTVRPLRLEYIRKMDSGGVERNCTLGDNLDTSIPVVCLLSQLNEKQVVLLPSLGLPRGGGGCWSFRFCQRAYDPETIKQIGNEIMTGKPDNLREIPLAVDLEW